MHITWNLFLLLLVILSDQDWHNLWLRYLPDLHQLLLHRLMVINDLKVCHNILLHLLSQNLVYIVKLIPDLLDGLVALIDWCTVVPCHQAQADCLLHIGY